MPAHDDRLTVNQNFRESPTLQKAIEDDAAELAANIGKTLVIRPAMVSLALPGFPLPGVGLGMGGEIDPRR